MGNVRSTRFAPKHIIWKDEQSFQVQSFGAAESSNQLEYFRTPQGPPSGRCGLRWWRKGGEVGKVLHTWLGFLEGNTEQPLVPSPKNITGRGNSASLLLPARAEGTTQALGLAYVIGAGGLCGLIRKPAQLQSSGPTVSRQDFCGRQKSGSRLIRK